MNHQDLPVYANRGLILSALKESQVLVVESPTGSGKTTGLPLILHEAGFSERGMIGVTQPRRIAAVSVSEFIARQLGTTIPGIVGYKMRFEDRTARETKIKIMTDGMLLQEMKLDPWLSKYAVLLVDEAHERSLTIDFILGLLKRVLENRKDFKVLISSATINTGVFSAYFGDCPIVKIDAGHFPITLVYEPPAAAAETDRTDPRRRPPFRGKIPEGKLAGFSGDAAQDALLDKVGTIITRFVHEKRDGDILVFLPGEKMIKECMGRLISGPLGKYLYVIPLYGRLGKEEQERVFPKAPRGKTKVVLSTNIAETSITIEGITAVIDSGLSKLNWYNPRSFTSSLVEAPVSKASANQRRGRAGRTCEGTCYRLYSRKDFENRPLFTTEEIFRTDLSEVILRMADLGISDFEDFDFISTPGKEGLIAGMETLNLLGALNPDRSLSTVGKMMTEFPLAPRQSRIIVEAILAHPEVLRETIVAAAFLSTQSPYVLPPGEETDARKAHHRFRDDRGDFISYLKLFRAFTGAADGQKFCEDNFLDFRGMAEIANVAVQLEEIAGSLGIPLLGGGDVDDYLCCVGRGMIQFVCVREGPETPERGRPDDGRGRKNASYRSLTADKITIHPGSVMFRMHPRYIVAGEIVRTGRTYAMSVSPLSAEVLRRIAPDFLARESGGQEGLFGSGRKKPGTLKKAGDFTDSITIAGEIFQVTGVGGKRTAVLPWEKLEALRDGLSAGSGKGLPKGLKGRIVFGNLLLLDGEKLGLILRLAPFLDPENALSRGWPRKRDFAVPEELEEILPFLDGIARPVPWKKGSRELGFLGLCATGDGGYRFRCSRGFHSALAESLASLEALIGESGEDLGPEAKDVLNQNYRRLSNLVLRD